MMRTKHKQGVRMASERIAVAESAISGLLSGAASRGPCGGSTAQPLPRPSHLLSSAVQYYVICTPSNYSFWSKIIRVQSLVSSRQIDYNLTTTMKHCFVYGPRILSR